MSRHSNVTQVDELLKRRAVPVSADVVHLGIYALTLTEGTVEDYLSEFIIVGPEMYTTVSIKEHTEFDAEGEARRAVINGDGLVVSAPAQILTIHVLILAAGHIKADFVRSIGEAAEGAVQYGITAFEIEAFIRLIVFAFDVERRLHQLRDVVVVRRTRREAIFVYEDVGLFRCGNVQPRDGIGVNQPSIDTVRAVPRHWVARLRVRPIGVLRPIPLPSFLPDGQVAIERRAQSVVADALDFDKPTHLAHNIIIAFNAAQDVELVARRELQRARRPVFLHGGAGLSVADARAHGHVNLSVGSDGRVCRLLRRRLLGHAFFARTGGKTRHEGCGHDQPARSQ